MANDNYGQETGENQLIRMSELKDYKVADEDPDIRKFKAYGADGGYFGKIDDLIVDTQANKVRYASIELEDEVARDLGKEHLLVPVGMAEVDEDEERVTLEGVNLESFRSWPVYIGGEPITREYETRLRQSFEPDWKPIREDATGPGGEDFYSGRYYDRARYHRAP